jgi:hypothetical protein
MDKIIDSKGLEVKIGDKVRGEGTLDCNDGFKIDLTPIVTVRKENGKIFFGGLSMQSFRRFYKITSDYKPLVRF